MKELQRAAVLISLVQAMKENGSWCGETSIQKAAYFLQELTKVPLELEFVLYKYGPYSFDLTDELTALRADSILSLHVPNPQYGPSFATGELSELILSNFHKTVARFDKQVKFVASKLGDKGVAGLERLATALFVRGRCDKNTSQEDRAAKLRELKPHVTEADAEKAVVEVDDMIQEYQGIVEKNCTSQKAS
jgi:uncharacterized protein YwgA